MNLYGDLYCSMARRIRVMKRNHARRFMIEYVIWLAIQTYFLTPDGERLSRNDAEKLFQSLEPVFNEPTDLALGMHQTPYDQLLMHDEKERRRAVYAVTGLAFTGRNGERL